MSSMQVFNRVQEFFPEGLLLDTSGNCFNLFMEFPTVDGRQASVVIWDEGVILYTNEGQVLSKEDYYNLSIEEDGGHHNHEVIVYNSGDTDYDTDGDASRLFDNNTMIEIGKTWSKYNLCFDKAMRGE